MNSLINKEMKNKSKNMFKAKINSLSKMNRMFGVLTSERENVLKIKTAAHDGKLPVGLLSKGGDEIKKHASTFSQSMEADAQNEKRP
jgi:hypothetical protein